MATAPAIHRLQLICAQIRLELLDTFSYGAVHHFGGCFSCVEIVACCYFHAMRFDVAQPGQPGRDRFIMSKGHAVPTQYVALSMCGYFPREELKTLKSLGSRLQGHPDMRKTPGIEAPTGSLGQGLSFANGVAMAAQLDGFSPRIFVLLGDGELHEGQVWEAALTSAHRNLGGICAVVDANGYQSQGTVESIKSVEPIAAKWHAFGWQTEEVDGHDVAELSAALDKAGTREKPLAIIARTVKGKGLASLEDTFTLHNASITQGQYAAARARLGEEVLRLEREGQVHVRR